jgi:hypothetical protein
MLGPFLALLSALIIEADAIFGLAISPHLRGRSSLSLPSDSFVVQIFEFTLMANSNSYNFSFHPIFIHSNALLSFHSDQLSISYALISIAPSASLLRSGVIISTAPHRPSTSLHRIFSTAAALLSR